MSTKAKSAAQTAVVEVFDNLQAASRSRALNLVQADRERLKQVFRNLAFGLESQGVYVPEGDSPAVVVESALDFILDLKVKLADQVRRRVLAEIQAQEARQDAEARIGALWAKDEKEREVATVLATAELSAKRLRPRWGEGMIEVEFSSIVRAGSPADGPFPGIDLTSFGFEPDKSCPEYKALSAQKPNGGLMWGNQAGTRHLYVWVGSTAKQPVLMIHNVPIDDSVVQVIVEAMKAADHQEMKRQLQAGAE